MPEDPDHRAQVDELLADYRRSRQRLAAVHRSLAEITESARSPDGTVTATVGARGTLTALSINDAAYQRYRPAELSELIVQLTGQAVTQAVRRAGDVLAEVLPPGTDPEALLLGTGDLAAGELAAEQPASEEPAEPDEENFEDRDWLSTGQRTARKGSA